MRHLKFRKKRKRAPHKAKLHFLSEKIHWNKKAVALWIAEIAVVCALAFILVFYFGQRVSNAGDSMRPELKNGDVVEILKHKNPVHPNEDWLSFTATTTARRQIHKHLRKT